VDDGYEGFSDFFHANRAALSRAAFLLSGSESAAEELVQSALTKVAARWPRLSRAGDPRAYARQVMLNEVRSRWRRRKTIDEAPIDQVPEDSDPSADLAEAIAVKLSLAKTLRRLTPKQRAVLYLRFYEDLSEKQTAELMNCSVGTVKSQTNYALRRMRELNPELVSEDARN
jgi:RNA polymerase sigma-70 factor (sigma-E family)